MGTHGTNMRFAIALVLTCLVWMPVNANVLDTVVPEDMPENSHLSPPSRLPPLALVATDAITTELANMKKIAPSDAGVAQIEGMVQVMNKESTVSSHRCDAKSTTDQATCSAQTTKAGCESEVDTDNGQKCTYQMDGGTKDLEDVLTSAKTSINAAITTMLSGVVTTYANAKKDLRAIDTAIDNSKQTISSTDLEAIKTKASTWCTKKRALETATSDASTAATALTAKLNEPLSLSDVLVKDVGTIGPSDCSQANSDARGSACQASSCGLASRIQTKIDTVRGEYLEASWVKFDKDALKSTAVTEESDSMGEFQGAVTATANSYHSMCGRSDQVHDTAVTLFNGNNAGRSTMYRSLGVILCHINHMSSGQTFNVPTDLLKSGEANPTTSASDCKGKLKSDTTIKADLFPDASSDEDSNKVCPALSAYEDDIRNYGGLGFDEDDWQPIASNTTPASNCDALLSTTPTTAPTPAPACEVTAYQHSDYNKNGAGWSATFGTGEYNRAAFVAAGAVNDDTTSLTVSHGCTAVVYQHSFDDTDPDKKKYGWIGTFNEGSYDYSVWYGVNRVINNGITSIKVFRTVEPAASGCAADLWKHGLVMECRQAKSEGECGKAWAQTSCETTCCIGDCCES